MIRVLVVVLALVEAGWMTFDGTRALVKGDYVTPSTGAHAGVLGPWSKVVAAVGIPPRSTGMKVAFVVWGVGWLAATGAYVVGVGRARAAMIALAAGSLWYAPVGTVLGIAQLALLLWKG